MLLRNSLPYRFSSVFLIIGVSFFLIVYIIYHNISCRIHSIQQKIQWISKSDTAQNQQYSIYNVPKFCSQLRSPKIILPILTPSSSLFQLNELGRYHAIEQADPNVIRYLWDHCDIFLRPPPGTPTRYQGPSPSFGQDAIVRKLLGDITNGFYVECGALDGILSSNTLILEKEFGWNGLLIEPDPSNLAKLYQNQRNAWISHSCLSLTPYPQEVIFQQSFDLGRIVDFVGNGDFEEAKQALSERIRVQCFPLYSFLVALNVSIVDYLSLDIEGDELAVLQAFPFDKILVKVISVEFLTSTGGETQLREFMEAKGYLTVYKLLHANIPFDLIFVHKSVHVNSKVLRELTKSLS